MTFHIDIVFYQKMYCTLNNFPFFQIQSKIPLHGSDYENYIVTDIFGTKIDAT